MVSSFPATLHFLLLPDGASARRVQRLLATEKARLGVIAGTWGQLIGTAADAYLVCPAEGSWHEAIENGMQKVTHGFWAGSLKVAAGETVRSVSSALESLISGLGPSGIFPDSSSAEISDRAQRHLVDLSALWEQVGSILPPNLAIIRELLDVPVAEAIRSIAVYQMNDLPHLSPWQRALVNKLNDDAENARDLALEDTLSSIFAPARRSNLPRAIGHVHERLFSSEDEQVPMDSSVQIVGVRDHLEEVEVVAGMIQKAISETKDLTPADFAILIPSDPIYIEAVGSVFASAGLSLSGLPTKPVLRDLGHEAILHFLLCHEGPAPAMVLAALLTSPLMPWPLAVGHQLATKVMNGDFRLSSQEGMGKDSVQVLKLIRSANAEDVDLTAALSAFCERLSDVPELATHRERAEAACEDLIAMIAEMETPYFPALFARVEPDSLNEPVNDNLTREGIAVFVEGHEPWRTVRRLYVLGFSSGHHPAQPTVSPVFSDPDFFGIRDKLGIEIDTGAITVDRHRQQFRRQVAAASDGINFLVPRRDASGGELSPSESLTFIAKLFKDIEDPNDIILDVDSSDDQGAIEGLAVTHAADPVPPRMFDVTDLNFGRDLLKLRVDDDGNPKPESPSSLETLAVSPLAWLLRIMKAEPSPWEPETLGPMAAGTIAHAVFENLFLPGQDFPDEGAITTLIPQLLDKAILARMPILRSSAWQVERRNLERDIRLAALRWREILQGLNARILGNELWLQGKLGSLFIHGGADCVLVLPDKRLIVVDYKKSRSTSRRIQMEKGYDSQASLYRTMLETDGAKVKTDTEIVEAISQAEQIAVLYFMMNDQTALTDTPKLSDVYVPGLETLTDDVSSSAIAAIGDRVRQIRNGFIELNRRDDAKRYEKETGGKPYALDNSPLIGHFMHEPPVEDSL